MTLDEWMEFIFKLVIMTIIGLLLFMVHWNHVRISEIEQDVYYYYEEMDSNGTEI